ncbi:hypothetical protein [Streptomyces fructofermentans]|uniref:Uncharacterized protein n=1 Tax=Streptomyces fructofermentans TaxID=152141 RepID=A0A918NEE5_9ACTN|nr:hypothetical protein [Streptomyces fructofermentans]GGX61145.1 hypothetical protein GCM10010515_31210 [Streptomyces fructofermentans]
MGTEEHALLRTELRAPLPEAFGSLDGARAALLADALRRARERRLSGLAEAVEDALTLVPALAREPVGRMLQR